MDEVRKPGAKAAFTYWEHVLKEWDVDMTEAEFWNYWFSAETPSEEMISFARELKQKGVKVITLSNNFKERAEHYSHYPWMHDAVDKAYFSWQTGLVKPDVEAWRLVLNDFALNPSEAIYFDGQEKNLKAAESLGIRAFMFISLEETRDTVEALLG